MSSERDRPSLAECLSRPLSISAFRRTGMLSGNALPAGRPRFFLSTGIDAIGFEVYTKSEPGQEHHLSPPALTTANHARSLAMAVFSNITRALFVIGEF